MSALRLFLIALLIGSVSGCAWLHNDKFWRHRAGYDRSLGQSRDILIQDYGLPDRCAALKDGGEVCEWRFSTGEVTNYTMDRTGLVRTWTLYHPYYGRQRNHATPFSLEAAR